VKKRLIRQAAAHTSGVGELLVDVAPVALRGALAFGRARVWLNLSLRLLPTRERHIKAVQGCHQAATFLRRRWRSRALYASRFSARQRRFRSASHGLHSLTRPRRCWYLLGAVLKFSSGFHWRQRPHWSVSGRTVVVFAFARQGTQRDRGLPSLPFHQIAVPQSTHRARPESFFRRLYSAIAARHSAQRQP
jgi:hypothetical protein